MKSLAFICVLILALAPNCLINTVVARRVSITDNELEGVFSDTFGLAAAGSVEDLAGFFSSNAALAYKDPVTGDLSSVTGSWAIAEFLSTIFTAEPTSVWSVVPSFPIGNGLGAVGASLGVTTQSGSTLMVTVIIDFDHDFIPPDIDFGSTLPQAAAGRRLNQYRWQAALCNRALKLCYKISHLAIA